MPPHHVGANKARNVKLAQDPSRQLGIATQGLPGDLAQGQGSTGVNLFRLHQRTKDTLSLWAQLFTHSGCAERLSPLVWEAKGRPLYLC